VALIDLFRPKWRHSDPGVRLSAVKGLADQAVLAQVAKTDPAPDVRLAAVEKLTDQEVLTQVATLDQEPAIGMAAVNTLVDQVLLARVAQGSRARGVCEAAVGKLTDQALLAQVARAADSPQARQAAVSKLTDQATLAEVAKTDSDPEVRGAAAKRLTDLRRALEQTKQGAVYYGFIAQGKGGGLAGLGFAGGVVMAAGDDEIADLLRTKHPAFKDAPVKLVRAGENWRPPHIGQVRTDGVDTNFQLMFGSIARYLHEVEGIEMDKIGLGLRTTMSVPLVIANPVTGKVIIGCPLTL